MRLSNIIFFLSSISTFLSCESDQSAFRITRLPQAQNFTIDSSRDTILFGQDGLRIFVPKGSFVDKRGRPVTGPVEITLNEALHPADQILMEAQGDFPQGMARIEAWQGDQQLKLDRQARVLVQFPQRNELTGLELRQGQVRRNGKVKWQKGASGKRMLIPVDFATLAFHPREFSQELVEVLPFGAFDRYNLGLADSLYFSFAGGQIPWLTRGFHGTYLNEGLYNPGAQFSDGNYATGSYQIGAVAGELPPKYMDTGHYQTERAVWAVMNSECGINPAKVKAAKAETYASTFLATPAFEERLRLLLTIGDESLLDLYLDNLDMDLWEIDQAVAQRLQELQDPRAEDFSAFAVQGLTNTKNGGRYAELLRTTHKQHLAAIEREVAACHQAIEQALRRQNEAADSLRTAYQDLLWRREQHRMKALTFELTSTGWIWPHPKPIRPTDTVAQVQLRVEVTNRSSFSDCQVYLVFPNIGSIYRLNEGRGATFVAGNWQEPWMWMKLNKAAKIVAVAHRNGRIYTAEQDFLTIDTPSLEVELKRSSRRELRSLLATHSGTAGFNQIDVDLEFMEAFQVERDRQSSLYEQQYALELLGAKAYPACNEEVGLVRGQALFQEKCAACHAEDLRTSLTGPALAGVHHRASKMWFIRYTENAMAMTAEGDHRAIQLWNEWGPTAMNSFPELTVPEIVAIYQYIMQN